MRRLAIAIAWAAIPMALTAAQQMADRFVLSLRSLTDSVPGTPGYAAFLLAEEKAKNNDIRLVRYGKIQDVRVSQ